MNRRREGNSNSLFVPFGLLLHLSDRRFASIDLTPQLNVLRLDVPKIVSDLREGEASALPRSRRVGESTRKSQSRNHSLKFTLGVLLSDLVAMQILGQHPVVRATLSNLLLRRHRRLEKRPVPVGDVLRLRSVLLDAQECRVLFSQEG